MDTERTYKVDGSKPAKKSKQKPPKKKTECGKVLRVVDGFAYVRFDRRAVCDKCGICRIDPDSVHVVCRVKNTLAAHTGDYVEVNTKRRSVLLSCLIYLLPLVLAVAGLFVGDIYSPMWTALGAAIGLAAGLAVAIPIDVFVFRRKLAPKMVSFATPPEEISDDDTLTVEPC